MQFTKGNIIGSASRFGPDWQGKRCRARTKGGDPCQRPAVARTGRCPNHGGKSTGPRTEEGRARIAAAQIKHGRLTRAAKEAAKRHAEIGRAIRKELRTIERELIAEGLLAKAWRDQFDYRSCE
ncbi:MAG: HGGxSTG domain-containing protein [Paracoccaceae bacterium]